MDGLDPQDIAAKVIKGEKLRDHAVVQIDKRLAELIEACRAVENNRRPSFRVVVETIESVLERM